MKPTLYESLRYFLVYDPETGIFAYRTTGKIAGWIKKNGRVSINLIGRTFEAHRLAWLYMKKEMPVLVIDHIDGNPTNNKWSNLRHVTQAENCKNYPLYKNSTSKVTGVSWDTHFERWAAYINVDGKRKKLGMFKHFVDAVQARLIAEKELGFHPNHGRATTPMEM